MTHHDASADDAAIRNLIHKMALTTDGGDLETYASLLAEDVSWAMPGAASPTVGRDAVVESSRARRATGAGGPGSGTRHLVSNVVVSIDGDTASSEACWQFWGDVGTAPVLRAMGRYEDTFRRTPSGWVYTSRVGSVG